MGLPVSIPAARDVCETVLPRLPRSRGAVRQPADDGKEGTDGQGHRTRCQASPTADGGPSGSAGPRQWDPPVGEDRHSHVAAPGPCVDKEVVMAVVPLQRQTGRHSCRAAAPLRCGFTETAWRTRAPTRAFRCTCTYAHVATHVPSRLRPRVRVHVKQKGYQEWAPAQWPQFIALSSRRGRHPLLPHPSTATSHDGFHGVLDSRMTVRCTSPDEKCDVGQCCGHAPQSVEP